MLKGGNWEQSTSTRSNPVHDNVFNVRVTWTSPFEAGAQNGIEISARVIEGFKIEKWGEYNHQPRDVMMPEQYQTFKFFTGNDKWGSDETVEDRRVLGTLFAQCFRGQATEKCGNAFNHRTSQRGNLRDVETWN